MSGAREPYSAAMSASLYRGEVAGDRRCCKLETAGVREKWARPPFFAQYPDYAPQFLALEFEEMIAFTVFMTAGVIFRWNAAAHKRLMVLSAVAISDAGFARAWQMGIKVELPGPFGWWLQFFWGIFLMLVAMAAWDLWRRRRIHPAVLFGAALLLTGEIIVTVLNFSPAWRQAMIRLVAAWGYSG